MLRLSQALLCLALGSCATSPQIAADAVQKRSACALSALTQFPESKKSFVVSPEQKVQEAVSCKLNDVITCAVQEKVIPAVRETRDVNADNRAKAFQNCISQ